MLLNLRESENRKIYLSSDFHLGHQREFVWEARGYKSPKEHDDGVIDTTNLIVRPNDILIFLGDFCLNTTIEQFDAYLDRIQCKNILMLWGNHNNPHEKKVYHKAMSTKFAGEGTSWPFPQESYPFTYKNVTFLGYYVEAALNGQFAVLCHYPILVWNEMGHGAWMLCGHSHYGCPATVADNSSGKILDVGWDGHKKPLTLAEISAIMATKNFAAHDNHHVPSAKTQ